MDKIKTYDQFLELKNRFQRNVEQLGSRKVLEEKYPVAYKNCYDAFEQYVIDDMNTCILSYKFRKEDMETALVKNIEKRIADFIVVLRKNKVVDQLLNNFLEDCNEETFLCFSVYFQEALDDIYIDYWIKRWVHTVHPDEPLPEGSTQPDGENPFRFKILKDEWGVDCYWHDEGRVWVSFPRIGWYGGFLPPTKQYYIKLRNQRIECQKKDKYQYKGLMLADIPFA